MIKQKDISGYRSNYDKFPVINVKNKSAFCREGWQEVCDVIREKVDNIENNKKITVLECYTGILDEEVVPELKRVLEGEFYFAKDYMLPEEKLKALIYPDVTDDEVFGYITRLELIDFFNPASIQLFRDQISNKQGNIYIYGPGAQLVAETYNLLIYFDMTRWEGQLRFRRDEVSNLGFTNKLTKAALQYKQAYFVDWRLCDKHKRKLMKQWDFVISTTQKNNPQIVAGKDLNKAYEQLVNQPFRVVPFFKPRCHGEQWMKQCNIWIKMRRYQLML